MQSEKQKEKKMKKSEQSHREIWDTIKHTNTHIIGLPKGKEREKLRKKFFDEIIAENQI